jgi:hypothetical protein
MHPQQAAAKMIARIAKYFPNFSGGIVAINLNGDVGAAAHGFTMPYTIADANGVVVKIAPNV